MRAIFEGTQGKVVCGRLEKGDILPDVLLDVCRQKGIRAGWLLAMGAVSKLAVTAYDQKERKYLEPAEFEGDFEILSLMGNVSLLDGKEFLHLHVSAAEETADGVRVAAGHLVSAEVFALEFWIVPVEGVLLERADDDATGLKLWR